MACSKTVYAMEKLEVDGKLYHKPCFRCKECNKVKTSFSLIYIIIVCISTVLYSIATQVLYALS